MANFGQNNRLRRTRDMDKITRMFVKAREYQKGQTMAEYALILSAVAVVVFVGYQTMGTTITSLLTTIDGKL
jgi:Flp pilus assembly pilin Flp